MTERTGSQFSPRGIAVLAAVVYAAVAVALLVVWGSELDKDSVFPGVEYSGGDGTFTSGPTPTNPPDSVLYAFAILGVVVTLPVAFPARMFSVALLLSMVVVAVALAVTVLRLGIFLAPVLFLQWVARSRLVS